MNQTFVRGLTVAMLAAVFATGCATQRPGGRAPVEDRNAPAAASSSTTVPTTSVAGANNATTIKPPPGLENAGKPGYYTVRPGDTLIRIALETGQPWRDIARWNNLDNPNLIEVGQVVRVVAPVPGNATPNVAAGPTPAAPGAPAPSASAPAVPPQATDTGVVTRPVVAGTVTPVAGAPDPGTSTQAAPRSAPPAAAASAGARNNEDEVAFIWPASGSLIAGFDEVKNKGLDISGKTGDPILAAADGKVVYAGAGLRGYGNLIIVQHNKTYLTAYAHNQTLLVREDQSVRKGQKIAEMGASDSDRVKLHFEVRRQGKPIDPAKLLPQR